MDIILDTNIFRRDLKLTDKNFDIILDYLKKTNSKMIFPQIVHEEVLGLYNRLLTERIEDYHKDLRKLNAAFISSEPIQKMEFDLENNSKAYIEFILKRLNISSKSIIPYKQEYLPELVERAIKRKKPLGENGQQFRDGLLWLTLLDIAALCEGRRLVFISDNPVDFCEKPSNKLATELKKEAAEKNVEINYYRQLSDFVKEHATSVSFITEKWIEDNLDLEQIENIFNTMISSEEDHITKRFDNKFDRNEYLTDYIGSTGYFHIHTEDFFVYEMSDGQILLNIRFEIEKEYEVEYEKQIEKTSMEVRYNYSANPHTGEMSYEPLLSPTFDYDIETQYKSVYQLFYANFVITLKEENILNYECKDWKWG